MTNPLTNIFDIPHLARSLANEAYIPNAVWTLFHGIHMMHRCWRGYRVIAFFSREAHYGALMGGIALDASTDVKSGVRTVARCLLVTQRVCLCRDQCLALSKSCQQFYNSLYNRYGYHVTPQWSEQPKMLLYSQCTFHRLHANVIGNYYYVRRIVICTYQFFEALFVLSMLALDAKDAATRPITATEFGELLSLMNKQKLDQQEKNQLAVGLTRMEHLLQNKQEELSFVLTNLQPDLKAKALMHQVREAEEEFCG